MTKKNTLSEQAQRLYVIEQMTLNEIAEHIGVNERTIRRWKSANNWDKKKDGYLNTKTMFHEELYTFARKLMSSIEYDIDNNEKVDPARFFTFTRMLPLITKVKSYEDEIAKKTKDNNKQEITPEFIKMINEEFLGIKYDEE